MLKPEHLTGNVRLVPLDRLPLAIAAIQYLEATEYEDRIACWLPPVRSAPPAKQNLPWPAVRKARPSLVPTPPAPVQKPRIVYVKKADLVFNFARFRVTHRGLPVDLPENAVKLVAMLALVMPAPLTFGDISMALYGDRFRDDAVRHLVDANAAALVGIGLQVNIVPKMGCALVAIDAG